MHCWGFGFRDHASHEAPDRPEEAFIGQSSKGPPQFQALTLNRPVDQKEIDAIQVESRRAFEESRDRPIVAVVVIPQMGGNEGFFAGQEIVAEWNVEERLGRSLRLTNGAYLCPQCDQATLKFSEGGLCWD